MSVRRPYAQRDTRGCPCTCHPHADERHPATGCCACCPAIHIWSTTVVDTFEITGRGTGYVLRMAEPLLMEGDHIAIHDDGGPAEYEVTGIERVMTMEPQQVINGCQSVLLKPIPAVRLRPEAEMRRIADDLERPPDVVQPPSAPPWFRQDVVDRHLAGDPQVVWESLSTPEQAHVLEERLLIDQDRVQPLQGHRALTEDVDGHVVTRTCSCGESFTTTADLLPVVWADHINRTSRVPDLRTRVAVAIRQAYRGRSDGDGDHEEWWYEAADAVAGIFASEEP